MTEKPYSPEIKKPSETSDDHLAFWKTWYTDQWANLIADGFTPQDIARAWQIDIGDGSDAAIINALEKKAQEKVASLAPAEVSEDVESAWVKNISDEWDALIDQDMEPREIAAMMGMDPDLFIGEDGIVDEELKQEAFRYEAGKRMRQEADFEKYEDDATDSKQEIEKRKVHTEFLPRGTGPARINLTDRVREYRDGAQRKAWAKELLAELAVSYVELESTKGTTDVLYLPPLRKAISVDDNPRKATYVLFDVEEESLTQWLSLHRINAHEMAFDPLLNKFQIIQWRGSEDTWKESVKRVVLAPMVERKRAHRAQHSEKKIIPEGWMKAHDLAVEMDILNTHLWKFFVPLQQSNPDWFSFAWDNDYRVTVVAPEVIASARQYFRDYKTYNNLRKAGWVRRQYLLDEFSRSRHQTISRRIEKKRLENPHWFRPLFIGNHTIVMISPEFVQWLNARFSEEQRPKDSVTKRELAKMFNAKIGKISNIVMKATEDHPEWFENAPDKDEPITQNTDKAKQKFFPPAIIEYVRDTLGARVPPKPGWKSLRGVILLIRHNNTVAQWVQKAIVQQRPIHPEWFEKAWSGAGFLDYFSPEFIVHLLAIKAERDLAKRKD